MNQPPLTAATRPDLAALPAYVEPPRQVTKLDRTKNSAYTILVIALGAGVCGGVALNQYKARPPAADAPFERFVAVPAEAPPPVILSPGEVPLPSGLQPVHISAPSAAPTTSGHLVASRPGSDRNHPQPARLTRPSNG